MAPWIPLAHRVATTMASLALAWLCLAVWAPQQACAQEASVDALDRDARREFDQLLDGCGEAYREASRLLVNKPSAQARISTEFAKAETLCSQARALANHPFTYYVVARIRHKTGRCTEAVSLYRDVLNFAAQPGSSEAAWLSAEGSKVEGHATFLDACQPRIQVPCPEGTPNALVVVDGKIVGDCGSLIEATAGAHQVALVAPGMLPTTMPATFAEGAPQPLTFAPLAARPPPSNDHLEVVCEDFADGAVVIENEAVLGSCPVDVPVANAPRQLTARGPKGRRGAILVPPPPEVTAGSTVTIRPLRKVALQCEDPDVSIQVEVASLGETIDGTCQALMDQDGPLELPEGAHTLVVRREFFVERSQSIDVAPNDDNRVEIAALDRADVAFTITCTASSDAPTTMVRVGSQVAPCPFSGRLPEGSYEVEARREGHDPRTEMVELNHPGPVQITLDDLEARSFWTPGVITAISGGGVLLVAVIFDVAAASSFNDLEDEFARLSSQPTITPEERAAFEDDKGSVNTNINVARVLYSVGLVTVLVGGGLIIYEQLTQGPDTFDNDEGGVSWSPYVVPLGDGDLNAGFNLTWRF